MHRANIFLAYARRLAIMIRLIATSSCPYPSSAAVIWLDTFKASLATILVWYAAASYWKPRGSYTSCLYALAWRLAIVITAGTASAWPYPFSTSIERFHTLKSGSATLLGWRTEAP